MCIAAASAPIHAVLQFIYVHLIIGLLGGIQKKKKKNKLLADSVDQDQTAQNVQSDP